MRSSDPTAASVDESSASAGGSRYFVGGIQRHITQQDLERYFGGFGQVEAVILKRDSAGNSRGYGWVQYRSSPMDLMRRDTHVLKGVLLTVEQARSTGHPDDSHHPHHPEKRPATSNVGNPRRRRRRSRSRSSSLSDSTSSVVSRRGNRRRYAARHGRSDDNTRLPSISVGSSRLPPLSSQLYIPPPPPARPSVPPTGYNTLPTTNTLTTIATTATTTPSGNNGDAVAPIQAAASVSDTYLCIPLTLCPSEYLSDPRTFCARLDQNRIGSLSIVPAPLVPSSATVPPPPPPAEHPGDTGAMNRRNSSNNNGPPPPGPPPGPPTVHGGMHRTVPR